MTADNVILESMTGIKTKKDRCRSVLRKNVTQIVFTDSAAYYYNDGSPSNAAAHVAGVSAANAEQSSRSPLAATRANSLASANSPTESGSACLKTEVLFNTDLRLE